MSSHPPDYDPSRQGPYPPQQWQHGQPDDHPPQYPVSLLLFHLRSGRLTCLSSILHLLILPHQTIALTLIRRRRNIHRRPPTWLLSTRTKARIPIVCLRRQVPTAPRSMANHLPRLSTKLLRHGSERLLRVGIVAGGRYVILVAPFARARMR